MDLDCFFDYLSDYFPDLASQYSSSSLCSYSYWPSFVSLTHQFRIIVFPLLMKHILMYTWLVLSLPLGLSSNTILLMRSSLPTLSRDGSHLHHHFQSHNFFIFLPNSYHSMTYSYICLYTSIALPLEYYLHEYGDFILLLFHLLQKYLALSKLFFYYY